MNSQGERIAEDKPWRVLNTLLIFGATRLDGIIKGLS
jgi:hypothetical protein